MMEWIYSVLAALLGVGMIYAFSRMDRELPRPPIGVFIIAGLITATVCRLTILRHVTVFGWLIAVYNAYLSLTAYSDAMMHKVYTLVNVVTLVGCLAVYLVEGIVTNDINWIPLGLACFFFALGWFRIYGRGDGYVLASMAIYAGVLSKEGLTLMLFAMLIGCGIFVIYSLADTIIRKKHLGEKVHFWRQKRPLLPSLVIGLVICEILIP